MIEDEPSSQARQAVLGCQRRFWLALRNKDAGVFRKVLADDFVCRSPDQEDQDRTVFIARLTSIPLAILNVDGEAIAIRFLGDIAVLTGTQIAHMRLPNGETISQRLALTNVFQHKAGLWKMVLAHPVALPAKEQL